MKTANEMFQDLGYKKDFDCVYIRFNPSGSYYEITIGVNTVTKFYNNPKFGKTLYEFTPAEILACAQFIKER